MSLLTHYVAGIASLIEEYQQISYTLPIYLWYIITSTYKP